MVADGYRGDRQSIRDLTVRHPLSGQVKYIQFSRREGKIGEMKIAFHNLLRVSQLAISDLRQEHKQLAYESPHPIGKRRARDQGEVGGIEGVGLLGFPCLVQDCDLGGQPSALVVNGGLEEAEEGGLGHYDVSSTCEVGENKAMGFKRWPESP